MQYTPNLARAAYFGFLLLVIGLVLLVVPSYLLVGLGIVALGGALIATGMVGAYRGAPSVELRTCRSCRNAFESSRSTCPRCGTRYREP